MQSREYKELLQYIEDLEKRVDKLEDKKKKPKKNPSSLGDSNKNT